ncbi:MAG: acyl-CoA dehydrogenase family protein [Micavibrio sp.]|nr:acyl-CoA dehydrogenase family protein [Micavibrio sp.]
MEFAFSAEENQFRDKVRTWLAENKPSEARPHDGVPMREFDLAWQQRKYESGWAGINWPKEYGGQGLSLVEQMIWHEECARARAPGVGCLSIALNHAGPTIILTGTEEQKATYLPSILRGELVWCQGFSEPGAGSDLAGLRLKATIDGNHLVLNGQKIWTSHAHLATYQETLVRTGPTTPKHKGITWLIVDMRTPGIRIRPIRTMANNYHFCEVFYDNVRVPLSNVVGEVDNGWRVAMSTLSFERGSLTVGRAADLRYVVEKLIDMAHERSGPDGRKAAIDDDDIGVRLAILRAEIAALQAMNYETMSKDRQGQAPGAEASMDFLYCSELLQRARLLALDILGADALELSGETGNWTISYLDDRHYLIAGGSAEIRRNIIAERILGLPRSS